MLRLPGAVLTRVFLVLTLPFLLIGGAVARPIDSVKAQEPSPQTAQQQAPTTSEQKSQKTEEAEPPNNSDQAEPEQPESAESKTDAKSGTKITPQQAEQLFHDVDTILAFASKDTGLPIKNDSCFACFLPFLKHSHPIKRRMASREEVVAYLKKNMAEDKDVQRLRRTELVLKKFGLLPRNFDLQTFLVSLLEEQVAGYYDSKTKTVNLLDWVAPDLQRPVLAHELTHALQDQSFALDKWLRKGSEDLDTKRTLTPADITEDENSEARQAVVEGQATLVLLDYILAPLHRTAADSPEVVDALARDLASGSPESVEYRNAPIFLKESLTFPYRYGIEFVAEVLRAGGKEKAYEEPFRNPPQTSREIMEPQTYLAGEHLPPLPLPDFKKIFREYSRFDIGAIGEFDVDVLAEQYAGEKAAHEIYPNWRGGYYYSVRPKSDPSGQLGLVFVSKWASAKAASQFAAIYARGIQQRYKNSEAPAASDLPADLKTLKSLGGDHTWKTEEGPVVIDVKGDMVLVTESLERKITDQFRASVLPAL